MTEDPEYQAIGGVLQILLPLEPPARQRVLNYVSERLGVPTTKPANPEFATQISSAPEVQTWTDFGELFAAFQPKSNSDKVMVAAYWLQIVKQQLEFTSFEVNKLLKDMGEGIPTNIYRDFERLAEENPARMLFLSGSGTGRNRCKLTVPGIKSVEERVRQ